MKPTTVQNDEHWEIVGQPRAVSIVSDALDAWDRESSLFLLLTGTVGVGKLELAKQVAQRLYGDCALRAMLVLDGNVDNADLVSTTISSHIQRQDEHGAVVILRHVEAFTARQIVHLCQLISQQDGVVFIGITGIGTRSIHQNLKQYGSMERIPKVELETTIRDEVDEYFAEDVAKVRHERKLLWTHIRLCVFSRCFIMLAARSRNRSLCSHRSNRTTRNTTASCG